MTLYSDSKNNLNSNEEVDLIRLINIILRNRLLIFLITSITTSVAILQTYLQIPIYKGSFQIFVNKNKDVKDASSISLPSLISTKDDSKKTQEF